MFNDLQIGCFYPVKTYSLTDFPCHMKNKP